MSSETVSSHYSAAEEIDQSLREASSDPEAYLSRARAKRQRQAIVEVHEELVRRSLARQVTIIDRFTVLLTIFALIGAALSLVVFFVGVFLT